jgi:chemotaxis protein methyltransferase CheR
VGLDLGQYKPAQVWRRVHAFASLRGHGNWRSLLAACRTDASLRRALAEMLTINVSEFFRNPEAWETLAHEVLRPRLAVGESFRAWSAGCSTGQEPYSLAILLRELAPATPARILATDVDAAALAVAARGRYEPAQMSGLSPARRERAFLHQEGGWVVRPEIRALVTFRRHDLLTDPAPTGFDLVLCRNVVIYFAEEAKEALYSRLAAALRPGGVLFIGATETITQPRRHGLRYLRPGFFAREAG